MPSRDYIQRMAEQRYEGEIRNAFLDALQQITDEVTLGELESLIAAGDLDAAIDRMVSMVPTAFAGVKEAERRAFAAAGRETAKMVPPRETPSGRVALTFNLGNQRAAQRIDEVHGELIREITEESRATIRDELRASLEAGENPREAARRIRGTYDSTTRKRKGGVLGLTQHQARTVRRARDRLLSGEPEEMRKYLGMKVRDKRFDRRVINAINEGRALSPDEAEELAEAYRRKRVNLRAETIGRDQALSALDEGQDEAFDQGRDNNQIRDEDVVEEWVTSRDARVREQHTAVPTMNRGGVRRGQMFQTPLGPLRKPRDRQSPGSLPANVIQCRCSRFMRVRRQQQ